MRFLDEANAIKENRGMLIKIQRKTNTTNAHKSELDVEKIKEDILIDNNGTTQDLYRKIDKVLKKLNK